MVNKHEKALEGNDQLVSHEKKTVELNLKDREEINKKHWNIFENIRQISNCKNDTYIQRFKNN